MLLVRYPLAIGLIKISDDDLSAALIDMLAVPGQAFANHRNNWGLNIFEESDILFDETVVGDSARYVALQSIARAQAHNVSFNYIFLLAFTSMYYIDNNSAVNLGLCNFMTNVNSRSFSGYAICS